MGWFFAIYVRETDFIPYPVINDQVTNENFRNSFSPESNPRKRKYEDKNYPLRSKIKNAREGKNPNLSQTKQKSMPKEGKNTKLRLKLKKELLRVILKYMKWKIMPRK